MRRIFIFLAMTLMFSVFALGQQTNAPANLNGSVKITTGTLNWTAPAPTPLPIGPSSRVAGTGGWAFTQSSQTRHMGIKIPQANLEPYAGYEIVAVHYRTGANAPTAYVTIMGSGMTRVSTNRTSTANAMNDVTLPTPRALDVTGDFYFLVTGAGANQSRTYLYYDNQGTGVAGQNAIYTTQTASPYTWTDASTAQTFCMWVDIRNPYTGLTYSLYANGTAVQTGLTSTTLSLPGLTAATYTVTATATGYAESAHSNGVEMGPVTVTPQNFTATYSYDDFKVHTAWNFTPAAGTNVPIFSDDFTVDPETTGWLNKNKFGDEQSWVQVDHLKLLSPPACMASFSWSGEPIEPDNWLITPQINGSLLEGKSVLTFWRATSNPSWGEEKYDVLISTTGTEYADFNVVLYGETVVVEPDETDWRPRIVDLTPYIGQNFYIAFRHYDCYDMNYLALDDVAILKNADGFAVPMYNVYLNNTTKVGSNLLKKNFNYVPTVNGACNLSATVLGYGGIAESDFSNTGSTEVLLPAGPCLPPHALTPNVNVGTGDVTITWKDPLQDARLIKARHDGIPDMLDNVDCIVMGCAWSADEMASWGDVKIKAVRYYLGGTVPRVGISVYSGASGNYPASGNSVYYANVTTSAHITGAGWHEYVLPTPLVVNKAQKFTIAFQHNATSSSNAMSDSGDSEDYRLYYSNLCAYRTNTTQTTQLLPNNTIAGVYGAAGYSCLVEAVLEYNYVAKGGEGEEGHGEFIATRNSESSKELVVNEVVTPERKFGIERFSRENGNETEPVTLPKKTKLHINKDELNILSDKAPETGRNLGFDIFRDGVKLNNDYLQIYTASENLSTHGYGLYEYKVSANYNDGCQVRMSDPLYLEYGHLSIDNLTVVQENMGARLNWDAVDKVGFTGYNIYCDGKKLLNVTTETAWIAVNCGTHEFQVCATFNNKEASKATIQLTVTDPGLYPARNLQLAQTIATTNVNLSWEEPNGTYPAEIISYSAGTVGGSVGLGTTTVTMMIACQFAPAYLQQLGLVAYNKVSAITTVLANSGSVPTNCTRATIFVSQTNSAVTFTAEQDITPVYNEWATYQFNTPVTYNTSQPLYIGVKFYGVTGFPFVDDGKPVVLAGSSNIYAASSGTPTTITQVYSSNWTLFGHLAYGGSKDLAKDVILSNSGVTESGESLEAVSILTDNIASLDLASLKSESRNTRVLTGYNIFKDNIKLNPSLVTDLTYIDANATPGAHTYMVGAVYGDEGTSRYAIGSIDVVPVSTDCATPVLTVQQIAGPKVRLSWTGSAKWITVYRDNEEIAFFNDGRNIYEEVPAFGMHTYYIETVTTNNCPKTSNTDAITFVHYQSTLSGTITSADGGVGIAGATVTLAGTNGNHNATTNVAGEYTIADVYSGEYTISVSSVGYIPFEGPFTMPEAAQTFDKVLSYKLLEVTGTVTGKDDAALGSVSVKFTNNTLTGKEYTTFSLGTGVYTLANVIEGNYTVTATYTGYFDYTDANVTVTTGETVHDIVMNILASAVSGTVYTDDDATPHTLAGAAVTLTSGALVYNTVTDENGAYSQEVEVGTYNIVASKTDFNNGQLAGQVVTTSGLTGRDIILTRIIHNFLTVNVTKEENNTDPISGATITFTKNDETYLVINGTTDASGEYIFMTIPQGIYTVKVEAANRYDVIIPAYNVNASMLVLDIEMEEDLNTYGSIAGTVTDGTNPINGATVTFTNIIPDSEVQTYTVITSETGAYTLPKVITGSYTYAATAYGCSNYSGDSPVSVTLGVQTAVPAIVMTKLQVTLALAISPVEAQIDGCQVTGGVTNADWGTYPISATASDHFTFTNWTKGTEVITTSASYNYLLEETTALTANFAPKSYTITVVASPVAGGEVSGGGSFTYGSMQTISATANAGYDFVSWSNGATTSSIDITVTGDATYTATFVLKSYGITASVNGSNGTITPLGITNVNHGGSQAYTITPSTGYDIHEVLVDGVNNPAAVASGTYTFSNVTAPHTIVASFIIKTFTITATAGTGGSITPDGSVTVEYNASKAFTFSPSSGYKVEQVLIDGTNNPTAVQAGSYTFENVLSNHTISVIFAQIQYQIVASVNIEEGGQISPVGLSMVLQGSNHEYTITTNTGYTLKEVLVDNVNVPAAVTSGTYTFTNVQANHTIQAVFEINKYKVKVVISPETGGTVEGATAEGVEYDYNSEATLVATAAADYKFVNWTSSTGVVLATTETYKFTVTEEVTVIANFEEDVAINVKQMNSFTVYPNPAKSALTVVRTGSEKARIEIYNANGLRVLMSETKDSKDVINVSMFPSGVYTIKLIDGNNVSTQKFVKE